MRNLVLCAGIIALSCAGEGLEVGNAPIDGKGGDSEPVDHGPGEPLPVWPTPDDCVVAGDSPLVGAWEGFFQDSSFNNVIPLRLELRGASELGGVCGTLRWGAGPPPPAATDPDRPYPNDELDRSGPYPFFDGVTYTIITGGMRDNTLRFQISPNELWKGWCELQAPYWAGYPNMYGCVPNGPGRAEGNTLIIEQEAGPDIPVDLDKYWLCVGHVCACNRDACGADPNGANGGRALFELTFEESSAIGTATGDNVFYSDVVLNRVE